MCNTYYVCMYIYKLLILNVIDLVVCESGKWGLNCSSLCNCGTGAVCNATTGCSFCKAGFTSGSSCSLTGYYVS